MKVEIEIQDQHRTVEIPALARELSCRIDGREWNATVLQPQPGSYLVTTPGGRIYEIHVIRLEAGSFSMYWKAREFRVRVVDVKHQRRPADVYQEGQFAVSAPMPGKVVSLLVRVGDEVNAGAGIVVVEAMKMQNELKTGKSGIVRSVPVEPGQAVASGQVLAIIE